jgi:hypothetical protein
MVEVKLTGKPIAERLADRLKNSGGDLPADVRAKHGEGARRTFHNIHHTGSMGGTGNRLGRDERAGGGNG